MVDTLIILSNRNSCRGDPPGRPYKYFYRGEMHMQTSVKMLDAAEGRVGGYLIVWGTPQQRDLQGEYFTPETELGLDWFDRRPVLYHHGLDGQLKAAVIGVMDTITVDETGVWVEAQLDLRKRYVRAVQRLIDRGILGWSSGSLPHLVEVADDGRIKRWPVVEGSLTPAPAEPRRTDVHTLKSAYDALGLDMTRLEINENNGRGDSPSRPYDEHRNDVGKARFAPTNGRGDSPSRPYDEHRNDLGKARFAPTNGRGDSPSRPYGEHRNDLGKVRLVLTKGNTMHNETLLLEDERPARKRLPVASVEDAAKGVPRIAVNSKFDNADALDLLHGYMIMRSAKSFHGVSEQYANALAHKIHKAGLSAIKADELSYSTQTGFGDEWVPDLWSAQIWSKARLENTILPLFRSIEMPSNPFEMPIEGTDPTVFFVPETTDEAQLTLGSGNAIPDSKVGSGKVQLAAKKLALRVGFSSELVEDAIIPVLNIYREQAVRAIADSIDYVLLNGDTEAGATGNINSDAAAPNSTDRFLVFDGLRKLPIVTNTANAVNAANVAPSLALLRQARFAMSSRHAARPNDLAWIVDGGTYAKFLDMSEFVTMDKAGTHATAQTGQIGFVDGAPVMVSAEMPLTEADGKVGNLTNDRGTAVCVYRPGWLVGYRRQIAASVDYIPYYDSYQLTATVRLAFARFDDDVASALYNLAV